MAFTEQSAQNTRESIKEQLSDVELIPVDEQCGPVKQRYNDLCAIREPYLEEARWLSENVMPYLYPREGTGDSEYIFGRRSPNQSLVAKGIINLASSLATTIFPNDARFFKNALEPQLAKSLDEQAEQMPEEDKNATISQVTALNNKLVARDQTLRSIIKASPDAENYHQSQIHAIMSGNACFLKPNLDTSKIYPLDMFAAEFDSSGELIDMVAYDEVHVSHFTPEQLKELYGEDNLEVYEAAKLNNIPMYTRQVRRHDHWEIQVEINNKRFPAMEGKEDLDAPPFIVYPFFLFPGRKMGIGWCSHNKGDIVQFENLSLSMNEMTKAACKVLMAVPASMRTTQPEIEDESGLSILWVPDGSETKIQAVLADVARNMTAIQASYEMVRQSLMAAFLMKEAIRRDAERVSAEEIKEMVLGLQDLLGGLYLSTRRRFQYPYARRIDVLAVRAGKVPKLPHGTTQLTLTAGVETMDNQAEKSALNEFIATLTGISPQMVQKINMDELAGRYANYMDVVTDGLLMTDDEAQAKAGVTELVQLANQLGPQGTQMVVQFVQQQLAQMAQGSSSLGQQGPQQVAPVDPQTQQDQQEQSTNQDNSAPPTDESEGN